MPTCPACRTTQDKRKKGKCPGCGADVDIYKGIWVQTGSKSPSMALLRHFENLVSDSLSRQRSTQVIFSFPVKSLGYRRELASAGEMFAIAEYDLELAKAAMTILFTDRKYSWKTRNTLVWLRSDFTTALAEAKALREAAKKAEEIEVQAAARVMSREDIFS
jgi:hypothetical protein